MRYRVKILILVPLIALCFTGCATNSLESYTDDLRWRMIYEENPANMRQYELLVSDNNYTGDCSNFAATVNSEFPETTVYIGQLVDLTWHAITCLDGQCVDNIKGSVFSSDTYSWKAGPYAVSPKTLKDF